MIKTRTQIDYLQPIPQKKPTIQRLYTFVRAYNLWLDMYCNISRLSPAPLARQQVCKIGSLIQLIRLIPASSFYFLDFGIVQLSNVLSLYVLFLSIPLYLLPHVPVRSSLHSPFKYSNTVPLSAHLPLTRHDSQTGRSVRAAIFNVG